MLNYTEMMPMAAALIHKLVIMKKNKDERERERERVCV